MEKLRVASEVTEREIIVSYLEHHREKWLPLYHRAQRAGGWSAEANLAAAEAFKPIDRLLDELGGLAVPQVVEVSDGE